MKMNIGMCPGYTDTPWEKMGNPFIRSMIEALKKKHVTVTGITVQDLNCMEIDILRKYDLLHLHWPGACYDILQYSNKWFLCKIANFLKRHKPGPERKLFWLGTFYNVLIQSVNNRLVSKAKYEIKNWAKKLCQVGIPIVWQQHDLLTHTLKDTSDYMEVIDKIVHQQFYYLCDAIIIHELSCLKPIVEYYGMKKKYSVAYLGPVDYGIRISRKQALKKLNIKDRKLVFSYIGTSRPNRNPEELLRTFIKLQHENIELIIAGQGIEYFMNKYNDNRISYFPGFIKPDTIRNIYCASDFFINDGKEYLTSMAIRNALEYGVPVIVYPFGSSLDMAGGAAIYIDTDGIEGAMLKAINMPEKERDRMKKNAFNNSKKRTWEFSAEVLYNLYKELIAKKRY